MEAPTRSGSVTLPDRDGLICAFDLGPPAARHGAGTSEQTPERPCWLHFNLSDTRARGWLARATLPELARELLLDADPRIHVHAFAGGVVAVLGDLNHDFDSNPDGLGTLRLFFDEHRFISARSHPLKTVDRIRRELLHGHEIATPFQLFEHFIESLAETFGAVVSSLGDAVDDAEDQILAGQFAGKGKSLGRARRLMVRLRRHITADRAALAPLPARLPAFCETADRQRLREAIERLDAVAQDLELVQERARLLQEEIANRLGEATNRNLFLLSTVTVALLPITLITGIFGMNVPGLPWAGNPNGFWWVMGVIGTIVITALALLHWREVL